MRNQLAISVVDQIVGSAPYMCEGDFLDKIAYAKKLGYDGVELNISNPARLDLDALGAAVEQTGVSIVAFGTGRVYVNEGISLTAPEEAVRAAARSRVKQFIDAAHRFNSIVIIGCIRGNIAGPEELPAALETLGQAMCELDCYAGSRGVTMVFEPINRYENNFLGNVRETAEFIHGYHLLHTKILMDTFHMNIEEPDFISAIENFGSDTAYVHIADSNRKYPGCGHINFLSIFRALQRIGYKGPFVAECQARSAEQRDEDSRAWLDTVRRLLHQVNNP